MGLLTDVYAEWIYLREVFDRSSILEPEIFRAQVIIDWPNRFIVISDDLLLEVGKGFGDGAEQDLQITVLSSGYPRFQYENRLDWPGDNLKLPWTHIWLKGRRGRCALATAIHTIGLDMAEVERSFTVPVQCEFARYRPPEKLRPIGATHLGEERIRTYLATVAEAIRDPESALRAFEPGGLIMENLVADDSIHCAIYLALRTGRKPDAVIERLSAFDISERQGEIKEFVKRAHARMHDPDAAAKVLRSRT